MARKAEFKVGDHVILEGVVGRTVAREDGDLVAVHINGDGIVTLHERWIELVDQSAEYFTDGLEVRLGGVVRRVAPGQSTDKDVSVNVSGTTIIITVSSKWVSAAR